MLIKLTNIQKSLGAKTLYKEVDLLLNPKEKLGFVGRNGMGKSTLLRIISGLDKEFDGEYDRRNEIKIVMTLQEHLGFGDLTALEYIMSEVPDFLRLEAILKGYESGEHEDLEKYTDAVSEFSEKGYYFIHDLILQSLADFQISNDTAMRTPLQSLSGGQKRFVELVRVMYSGADVLLIDEPTNHMDFVGKEMFINWLKGAQESMLVVTHDRDVLRHVDKMIELKDQKLFSFDGNFAHYLKQNTTQTTNDVVAYQTKMQQLKEAEKKVEWGNRMRAKSKAWKIKYDHFVRDYERIKASIEKPSFWIDQESMTDLDERVVESYEKFKEKNVQIKIKSTEERVENLLRVERLSLGYDKPLFANVHFEMKSGSQSRVFIKGRNGAGKSTLVRTIMAMYRGEAPEATIFEGRIVLAPGVRIGEYEQEIAPRYLGGSLSEGIRQAYEDVGQNIDDQNIKRLLAQYLFDPKLDMNAQMSQLSGGQKARFQVIKMLANNPNLLILDEPTNHLDLPSIEELENSLTKFSGGILYISHDNYFIQNMGGEVIKIGE